MHRKTDTSLNKLALMPEIPGLSLKAVLVPIPPARSDLAGYSRRSQGGGVAGCPPWRRGQATGAGLAGTVGLRDHRR